MVVIPELQAMLARLRQISHTCTERRSARQTGRAVVSIHSVWIEHDHEIGLRSFRRRIQVLPAQP
jgi:hypothetical protein